MNICLPRHEIPKLNHQSKFISFENSFGIKEKYKDILGLKNISHLSINIVNEKKEMSVLSANPQILFNLCKDGSLIYNGSVSPSFYSFLDLYSWDDAYDKRFHNILTNTMERKHGITKGVVIVRRLKTHTILYSFATTKCGERFVEDIKENTNEFYAMGDYCMDYISDLYSQYCFDGYDMNLSNKILQPKPVQGRGQGKIIKLSDYRCE